jgi:ABC-2 type transport system ATP-binding protein
VLIHDPDLVLLDEPAAGLDPRARNDLMNILRELRRMGKTIVVSSHILSELAELCDAVTIMDRGRVKYSGPIQHLSHADCENPAYMLTLQEDKADVEQRLSELPGVLTVERAGEVGVYRITCDAEMPDSNLLLRGALSLGIAIESFTAVRKELNQAFMDLTERGIN